MSTVKVKNKKGTSDDELPRGCVSWKDYWEAKSGKRWPSKCCVENCKNKAEVGAHVYKTGESEMVYIIPMCNEHNNYNKTEVISVDKDYLLKR